MTRHFARVSNHKVQLVQQLGCARSQQVSHLKPGLFLNTALFHISSENVITFNSVNHINVLPPQTVQCLP